MITAYAKTPVTRTSEGMFLKPLLPVCKMEMPSREAPPGLSTPAGRALEVTRDSCAAWPSAWGAQAGGECCPPPVWRGRLSQLCSSN